MVTDTRAEAEARAILADEEGALALFEAGLWTPPPEVERVLVGLLRKRRYAG